MSEHDWHGTTILCVRKAGKVVIAGDGQVSTGPTILKGNARKVRTLANGAVITGFAGATADAFALFERLEQKLERFPSQLARASVELAKDWRTDRALRRLDAMLIVADAKETYLITGAGDVLDPEHKVIADGSGGNFALAAALALYDYVDDADAFARMALAIAADICFYTTVNLTVEKLECAA
jgi:ATP-dependent HslUV protease subunit HslV